MSVKYKRVLLKLSGEALSGDKGFGLDMDTIQTICKGIKDAHDLGAEIAIVVGGGNFWRGRSSGEMERTRADQIGMLATAMNALAVADALEHLGVEVRVQTALSMQQIAEPYIRNRAIRHLEKGESSFWPAERATRSFPRTQLRRCALRRSTRISSSRRRWWTAFTTRTPKICRCKKYDTLTFSRVLADQLAVMDSTAATMCRDNSLPILVFDILHPENIAKAVAGEPIGTLVVEQ